MIKIICPNCEIEFTSKILSEHKESVCFCCYCGEDVISGDDDEEDQSSFLKEHDDEED